MESLNHKPLVTVSHLTRILEGHPFAYNFIFSSSETGLSSLWTSLNDRDFICLRIRSRSHHNSPHRTDSRTDSGFQPWILAQFSPRPRVSKPSDTISNPDCPNPPTIAIALPQNHPTYPSPLPQESPIEGSLRPWLSGLQLSLNSAIGGFVNPKPCYRIDLAPSEQ